MPEQEVQESQDWAQMLSRMYTRWIDNKNLKKSINGYQFWR